METIVFTCETITPMFLAGADGKTPEWRASSIKGAMRFWWRALNGHIRVESENILGEGKPKKAEGLRDQEAHIFGGAGMNNVDARRSSFAIQVIGEDVKPIATKLVPHKESGFMASAFPQKSSFQVIFRIPLKYSVKASVYGSQDEIFSREKLIALFQLTSILGGIGKRVRRGMGSWQIISAHSNQPGDIPFLSKPDINDIYQEIKKITPHYYLQPDGVIVMDFSGRMDKYPWVRRIEIGAAQPAAVDLPYKISKTTHDLKKPGTDAVYNVSLGHAWDGRFASPIYVSVLPDNRPIITTLNTIPDRDIDLINPRLQDQFKRSIL